MNLPPYLNFPTIRGEKISLREITNADIPDLIEISFYDAVQAKTIAEATAMQEKIEEDYLAGNSIHWGIADNNSNKILGTCGFYRGLDKGEGELGCVLLVQYRGKGFMSSAMQLAIDFGLQSIKLKRIWAITNQQNTKAINLLERLNFIKIKLLEDEEVEYEIK